ncbi:hypothetical protein C8J57DRAFT_1258776 [Mycena rebaudengoi]|nr:hypothetical protein C8J57DRAFT_1258776 [Mycena rebaudengoi]
MAVIGQNVLFWCLHLRIRTVLNDPADPYGSLPIPTDLYGFPPWELSEIVESSEIGHTGKCQRRLTFRSLSVLCPQHSRQILYFTYIKAALLVHQEDINGSNPDKVVHGVQMYLANHDQEDKIFGHKIYLGSRAVTLPGRTCTYICFLESLMYGGKKCKKKEFKHMPSGGFEPPNPSLMALRSSAASDFQLLIKALISASYVLI